MAAPILNTNSQQGNGTNYTTALITLTSLFFMWGFLTSLNDILIPHLKSVFELSYAQVMLVQSAFFIAYFVMSLPAGWVVSRFGYRIGILTGLGVAGLGALLFYPAAAMLSYPMFLAALFVLASGITVLQVAANPYVAVLGPEKTASSRLTLSQALNSLGHTLGPYIGAGLILSGTVLTTKELLQLPALEQLAYKMDKAAMVQVPYIGLALALVLLMVFMALVKLPVISNVEDHGAANTRLSDALKHKGLILAAIGIFVYVGAEVSIGSFLVNFFGQPNIGGLKEEDAGKLVSYYWLAAMIGRFLGSFIMQKFDPAKALGFSGIAAIVLLLATILGSGQTAMVTVISIGLFNSIMFPTIFTLGINGLGKLTGQGSAVLVMCIVGGGVIPLLQGALADSIGIQKAFIIPVVCYAYIVWFAFSRGGRRA
jgi:FHS family L-fucose permease-like MFS transporter